MAQENVVRRSPLENYANVVDYQERHGGALFPTRSSVDWFIKHHREELIARDAIIPGEGRRPTLVECEKFPRVAVEIRKRLAVDKIERNRTTR